MNIIHQLDRFIFPALFDNPNSRKLFKSRILIAVTLMYLSSMVMMGMILCSLVFLKIFSLPPAIISCAVAALLYSTQLYFFKKTGNLTVAAHICMLVMVASSCVWIYITGGNESPMLSFLYVPPMFAFLVAGYRGGIVWAVLSIFVYIAYGLSSYLHLTFPMVIPDRYHNLFIYVIWVYSWSMIVGGVLLYSVMVHNLNTSVNNEKEKLRAKAVFDEETGILTRRAFNQKILEKSQNPALTEKSFALVFLEIQPSAQELAAPPAELVRQLTAVTEKRFGRQATISRYSSLAMTIFIASDTTEEDLIDALNSLYLSMNTALDTSQVEILFGASCDTKLFNNVRSLVNEARAALHTAKAREANYVCYALSSRKPKEIDYLSRVTTATYQQIIGRSAS